jgi:hypothetical protein
MEKKSVKEEGRKERRKGGRVGGKRGERDDNQNYVYLTQKPVT